MVEGSEFSIPHPHTMLKVWIIQNWLIFFSMDYIKFCDDSQF